MPQVTAPQFVLSSLTALGHSFCSSKDITPQVIHLSASLPEGFPFPAQRHLLMMVLRYLFRKMRQLTPSGSTLNQWGTRSSGKEALASPPLMRLLGSVQRVPAGLSPCGLQW